MASLEASLSQPTKCFMSRYDSQGQSVEWRPAAAAAAAALCVCAADSIWELTPICGWRSLCTPPPKRDMGRERNGEVKRQ